MRLVTIRIGNRPSRPGALVALPGDVVELEVECIGVLRNRVVR